MVFVVVPESMSRYVNGGGGFWLYFNELAEALHEVMLVLEVREFSWVIELNGFYLVERRWQF